MTRVIVPKRNEDTDEQDDARDAWLAHPFTETSRERIRRSLQAQMKFLKAACGESTDPKVQAAYAKYLELEAMLIWFEKGK